MKNRYFLNCKVSSEVYELSEKQLAVMIYGVCLI